MDQLAHTILDTLGMGNDGKTHMAYGTIVNELKEVSRSYKEARMALDVGKIFFGDKEVKTVLMFRKHQDSFTSIETLWSIASINSRRVQVLISVFLKMPLHSRLHSW